MPPLANPVGAFVCAQPRGETAAACLANGQAWSASWREPCADGWRSATFLANVYTTAVASPSTMNDSVEVPGVNAANAVGV